MDFMPPRPLLGVPLQDETDLHRFVARLTMICTSVALAVDVTNQMVFFLDWPIAIRSWCLTLLVSLSVTIPSGYIVGRSVLRANRLATKLSLLKVMDPMTGLPNGKCLREDFEAAQGSGRVLLIADVDHMSNINETFGHGCGDDAISRLARIAADELGDLGKVYRTHSDELVLLATPKSVHDVANRALSFIARTARTDFGQPGQPIFLTISVGITAVQSHVSFGRAFADTERALQNARTAGRNRHHVADDHLPFAGIVESDEIAWESRPPVKMVAPLKRMAS
ncbi:GGDEF domain-containing protein [Oryzibacter oryziterrae]|uniref:GGDEF domain-containing protein n=1 Tax=Oryzibacter oryziterrae TaxID=2766474 RepID=UPI001F2CE20B|nr:GGDEF domain-containing protein [Oryzibacter oryziterrae]